MLRDFRSKDADEFIPLYRENFAEEEALLGTDPVAMGRITRRLTGPFTRLALTLARWIGRPIVRFFVVEVDGHLAGTALLSFTPNAGYVGLVQVAAPYRRRGLGQELLSACARDARRAKRRYLVLDVLTENVAARALYDKLGFHPLRQNAYWVRYLGPEHPIDPSPFPLSLRSLQRGDGDRIAAIARAQVPPEVQAILPVDPRQYYLRPMVSQSLESDSEGWILEMGGRPSGFLRITTSHAMEAGHLTAPVIDASVPADTAVEFLRAVLRRAVDRGARRILCEVTTADPRIQLLLTGAGFEEAYRLDTLYEPLIN
jgi:ribosomal protein S18 acetylase RimI-like enzyme